MYKKGDWQWLTTKVKKKNLIHGVVGGFLEGDGWS